MKNYPLQDYRKPTEYTKGTISVSIDTLHQQKYRSRLYGLKPYTYGTSPLPKSIDNDTKIVEGSLAPKEPTEICCQHRIVTFGKKFCLLKPYTDGVGY